MPTEKDHTVQIYIALQNNGYLVLDKDRSCGEIEMAESLPPIDMTPISIRELVESVRDRNLDWSDSETVKKLKTLLQDLEVSVSVIEDTLGQIGASK